MSINIDPNIIEDVNNIYVNYSFSTIPSNINYIIPANVVMMNFTGNASAPNFTYTSKNIMVPTNASKYISSIAYLSTSDFTYSKKNTTINSNSLQITFRCTSLDDASTIYCIFFVNNGKNEKMRVLTELINNAIAKKPSGHENLDLTGMYAPNPSIAYFTQTDKTLGDIRYFLFLTPLIGTFDISKFGSLKNVDSQLLTLYKPAPKITIYSLTTSIMQKPSYVKESFQGFREGMHTPSYADASLPYNKDVVGVVKGTTNQIDPSGGTVMFYGEDMICQESTPDNSEKKAYIPEKATPQEIVLNYTIIGIVCILLVFGMIYGIPWIIRNYIQTCFSKQTGTAAITTLLLILFSKNVFLLISLAIWGASKASDKQKGLYKCPDMSTDTNFIAFFGGLGGFFDWEYLDKIDSTPCIRTNVLPKKIDSIGNGETQYEQIVSTVNGSLDNTNIKNMNTLSILKTVSLQIWSLFIFLFLTCFFISFGLIYGGLHPAPTSDKTVVKLSPNTTIAGVYFAVISSIIYISATSCFVSTSEANPFRVSIDNTIDLLYVRKYGYMFVNKDEMPKFEDE
jgi:hypothetical protein